jgi:hypothetical protein
VDLLASKFNVSLAPVAPSTSKDLDLLSQGEIEGDDQYDPLKEYYRMMREKIEED